MTHQRGQGATRAETRYETELTAACQNKLIYLERVVMEESLIAS